MTFRFGPFEADREAYRVTRGAVALDLTPKLLDLLFYFLDRPGRLITKEELLDGVWPGANVTENAMAQALSDLREALGDDAASPTFIRTIARRGYRFIADVHTVARAPARPARAAERDADPATLAVMDFVNVTNEPDVAWLGAGIAETVTSDLAALGHFRVVDRLRVVDAVRHTDGLLRAVGEALGALLMVTGAFQRSGPLVRVTARAVDLGDGEAVADAKVDGRLEDVFALQDGIVRAFAREMGLPVSAGAPKAAARETKDLDAYRAYIEGWLKIESLDLDLNAAAIADFERAIAIDPRYASAYTGLATAEFIAYEMSRSTRAPNFHALRDGIEHARHAVRLDPELADAHAALSFVLSSALQFDEARRAARQAVALEPDNWRHHFRLGHANWGGARLRALERALELYPHFAYTRLDMAMVQIARGQFDAARDLLHQGASEQDRQSQTADRYPAVGFHYLLGALLARAGEYDAAIEEFDREVRQAGQHGLYRAEYAAASLVWRGHALVELDRIDDAADAFGGALRFVDGYPRALLGLSRVRARQNRTDDAIAARDEAHAFVAAIRQSDRSAEWLYGTACLAAAGGDADAAISALNYLLDSGPASAVGWQMPIEPAFLPIRRHAGFAALLARLADRAK